MRHERMDDDHESHDSSEQRSPCPKWHPSSSVSLAGGGDSCGEEEEDDNLFIMGYYAIMRILMMMTNLLAIERTNEEENIKGIFAGY